MKRLQNVLEQVVEGFVVTRINEGDVCDCKNCRLDMTALVLGKLPTHYVYAEDEVAQSKLPAVAEAHRAKITEYIVDAVDKVKANPRH